MFDFYLNWYFLKSYFNMRYLTVIIVIFFIITFLTYGGVWLFELKISNFFVHYLKSYLH